MEQNKIDEMFMRRCLQLAKNGRENAKPNPMVGAVIVSGDGRIIGEGYHEPRTLLSLRQDAALCRFDSKKRSKAMRLRLRRSFC